jgi:tetratricopeptide (TPR) repeat protein
MLVRICWLLVGTWLFAPTALAVQEMEELKVVGSDGRLQADTLVTYLDSGRKWDGRVTEAIDAAEAQIAAGETDPYVYALAARLYLVAAQFAGSQSLDLGDAVLEKGLALAPDYASLRELRVAYALRRGCSQCAQDEAQEMVRRLPDDPLTRRVQGRLAQESGLHDEAVEHLRAATRGGREYNPSWTHAMLATSLQRIGRTDEAVEAWKKAAELAPYNGMTLGNYATVLQNYRGEFEQAARLADRVLETSEYEQIANIRALAEWGRWARAYERDPRSEQAATLLASARRLLPDTVQAFQFSCEWPGSRPTVVSMLRSKLVSEGRPTE